MRRFVALDSWRGLCALLVACYHFQAPHTLYGNPLIRNGFMFVDFFFVLSGFVIGAAYGNRLRSRNEVGRFLVLRLGRVYPLHLALLLLFVLLEATLTRLLSDFSVNQREPFSGPYSVHSIFTNLLLVHSWGFERIATWNVPSWSISTEFFAYLVFAAIAFFARSRQLLVLGVLVLALPPVILAVRERGWSDAMDFGTLRCLLGFALGVLVYAAWDRYHERVEKAVSGTAVTAIEWVGMVATVAFVCMPQTALSLTLAPFVFALTVLAFSFDRGGVSRFLQLRPFVFLGMLSYSIYMVHVFVQARMFNGGRLLEKLSGAKLFMPSVGPEGGLQIGTTTLQGNFWFLVMLAAVVVTSWITFRLIEEPMRDRSRVLADRWFGKSAKPPAPPPHS